MVECCDRRALAELTENARASRLFLEELFVSI